MQNDNMLKANCFKYREGWIFSDHAGKAGGLLAIILLIALLLAIPIAEAQETHVVTDMAGREVVVPADPQRIIALGPGALRLIVYLQAHDRVVGVEDMEKMNPRGRPYWLASPELHDLPRCGPGGPAAINRKPELETIMMVNPELIFVTYMDAALADEVQRTLNIPVVILSYGAFATFDETVYDSLHLAGTILNRSRRAQEVVDYIQNLRQELHRRTFAIPPEDRPAVYIGGIGHRGAKGLESTEQRYLPLTWVNARNLADTLDSVGTGTHFLVNREVLLDLNPEIIFLDGGGLSLVTVDYQKRPDYYASLRAFHAHRVYILPPFNWYVTNIDTALASAFAIGKILYPEQFADIDPEAQADVIYTFLTGQPVYDQMRKDYGVMGGLAPFLQNRP